jgi:hypothetical protein
LTAWNEWSTIISAQIASGTVTGGATGDIARATRQVVHPPGNQYGPSIMIINNPSVGVHEMRAPAGVDAIPRLHAVHGDRPARPSATGAG